MHETNSTGCTTRVHVSVSTAGGDNGCGVMCVKGVVTEAPG